MSTPRATGGDLTTATRSGWQRFWDRGGWWKALLAAAVYLALYLGAGRVVQLLFGSHVNDANPLADATSIFIDITSALVLGAVVLLVFVASLRWLPELFGRQPVEGRAWMWIAPAIVLAAAVLRLLGTDFGHFGVDAVVMLCVTGLFIGFTEELLTRGIAVNLLRRGGYSERSVMLLSSLIFALLHSSNLLSGQSPATVALTMVFTFVFGVAMYLTLRVTGSLLWPILLHAITDPTTMLATGGIDASTVHLDPLTTLAGRSIYLYAILALVTVFAVRGRVGEKVPSEPQG